VPPTQFFSVEAVSVKSGHSFIPYETSQVVPFEDADQSVGYFGHFGGLSSGQLHRSTPHSTNDSLHHLRAEIQHEHREVRSLENLLPPE